ncbi:MAG: 4-alpha-glucanotransferase [bacterium]|nr:4-alpha-glucanotransferase [bacterium]
MNKQLDRGAGILLPISSLPSPYGIGTLGKAAYHFVDQLAQAKQTYWQVLPIGPTSFGDSPYQSFSTFAGNPYFIDLNMLAEEGLLDKKKLRNIRWGDSPEFVSYETIWKHRFKVLHKAYDKFVLNTDDKFDAFCESEADWLEDYSFYMALKEKFDHKEWLLWEDGLRFRKKETMEKYKQELKEEIRFWKFLQYKFFEQWKALKKYANKKKIKIIGDIPIYVAIDSADIWANPSLFKLDKDLKPTEVAGCPPDAFSDEGQKWGNPLYDWKQMEQDDFAWWKKRMKAAAKIYDVIRIDHFIGIVRYYVIPVDKSAKEGWFLMGPGMKLIHAIDKVLGDAKVIAEDLGVLVPKVGKVLNQAGYPGMKVLEFAFDGNRNNPYLPHCYKRNCVVYGGTHDNDTLEGYYDLLPKKQLNYAMRYCGAVNREELVDKVIAMAYASVADMVIFQMQDILKKDNSARMNYPSTIGNNWRWRLQKGEFKKQHINMLKQLTLTYGRI